MPDDFISGPDWEQSSGPILSRAFDASADLWPHGAESEIDGGDKDVLENGHHPVLAVGPRAQRPANLTGVVISYTSNNDRAVLNLAEKVITRQYVANVTTYSGGNKYGYDASMQIGELVYLDDSDALSAGVTLSRSPLNSRVEGGQPNPLAGYLMYCQTEYDDSGVGGATASTSWPKTQATQTENEYCVMLVNDFGIAGLT